jgi:RNA polymerase sigma-70 factor (ECF subfamily)
MEQHAALTARLARDLDGTFPLLVAEHEDRLFTIALRLLGDRRDAEEVAQDTLVRAYRAMAAYAPTRIRELRLGPWLASIAVNLARNRRRRHDDRNPPLALDPIVEAGYDPPADGRGGPAATTVRRETMRELATALLNLPPAVRAAVVLRHVDGLSVAETAEALGRPEGTVKAQVHRGLRQLRHVLEVRPPASSGSGPDRDPDLAPVTHVRAPRPRALASLEALP